jgi:hypothetical protein
LSIVQYAVQSAQLQPLLEEAKPEEAIVLKAISLICTYLTMQPSTTRPSIPLAPTFDNLAGMLEAQLPLKVPDTVTTNVLQHLAMMGQSTSLWRLGNIDLTSATLAPVQRDFYRAYYSLITSPHSLDLALQLLQSWPGPPRSPWVSSVVGAWIGLAQGSGAVPRIWQVRLPEQWHLAIVRATRLLLQRWLGVLNPSRAGSWEQTTAG